MDVKFVLLGSGFFSILVAVILRVGGGGWGRLDLSLGEGLDS